MRCFVGCFVEPRSAVRLEAAIPPIAGARRVPRGRFHLTLRFLGNLDAEAAERAATMVAGLGAVPVDCTTAGLGGYPRGHRARVVFVRIVELPLLRDWSERLREAPEAAPDARAFEPHVTIARSRSGARVPESPLLQGLVLRLRPPALYVSLQGSTGPRYVRFAAPGCG